MSTNEEQTKDQSGDYQAVIGDALVGRPRLVVLSPQPPVPDWCEPGQCTFNASELADEWGLTYAEGWAKADDGESWVAHAWTLDAEGRVIDPTWTDAVPGFTYVEAGDLDPFCRASHSGRSEVRS